MFYGEYRHTVDSKGRLFIPAKFREKLGTEFILSRGLDECIWVYPMAEWERFTEKLEALPMAKDRQIRRFFYAGAYEGSVDAQGRVTISQKFRDFAHLEKDVVILGHKTHFEIWPASAWDGIESNIDVNDIISQMVEIGI